MKLKAFDTENKVRTVYGHHRQHDNGIDGDVWIEDENKNVLVEDTCPMKTSYAHENINETVEYLIEDELGWKLPNAE